MGPNQNQRWKSQTIFCLFVLGLCLTAETTVTEGGSDVPRLSGPQGPHSATVSRWELRRDRRSFPDDTEISGSGSGFDVGSGLQFPASCTRSVLVEPFSLVSLKLNSVAKGCMIQETFTTFLGRETNSVTDFLTISASNNTALFADYFVPGQSRQLLIRALCGTGCQELQINLNLTVSNYDLRLLPYGTLLSNKSLGNVDDSVAALLAYQPIPAFDGYHSQFYVSSNGLVSLDEPFLNWHPISFPYGSRQVPILAPYWTDFDFRATSPQLTDNTVYYSTNELPGSQRDKSMLNIASEKVHLLTNEDGFEGRWMLTATWSQATPYFGQENINEASTFQLVLVTNYTKTYALYLYNTTNWERQSQPIVVGYTAANYKDYENIEFGTQQGRLLQMATEVGNSAKVGEWVFDLTPAAGMMLERDQLCFEWAAEEEKRGNWYSNLPACPCAYEQALQDRRYSFTWGSGDFCAIFVNGNDLPTTECCYDGNTGALLVGAPNGGGYRYHNPMISRQKYEEEDTVVPRRHCCQYSNLCEVYYRYRQSDDCSRYAPVRTGFTWGDPHFESVDGNTFTFNGIGEYVLLRSTNNHLHIQARLARYNMTTNASVVTAVVMKNGISMPVQVEADTTKHGQLSLFVNGVLYPIPVNQSTLFVTTSAVYNENELSTADIDSIEDTILIRNSNGILILSTPSQVIFSVASQLNFIYINLQLGSAYSNLTEGLLGTYNNNPQDDFRRPDGNTIPITSTEYTVFTEFGLQWHLTQSESIFYYHNSNYNIFNTDTPSFYPLYGLQPLIENSVLNATANKICDDDYSCRYDIAVTGNGDFGRSTNEINQMNKKLKDSLENFPPKITGPQRINIVANKPTVFEYLATDDANDEISIFLNNEAATVPGIILNSTGFLNVCLSSLPDVPVYIIANDSSGRTTHWPLSFLLCDCQNGGLCIQPEPLLPLPTNNDTRHYRLPCTCPSYAAGKYCEIDIRGCDTNSCPEYTICQNDSTLESGFSCSQCKQGYETDSDGKCVDVDECATTNSCTHTCMNTRGSYTCSCPEGYRLSDNNACVDINECLERTDNCEQFCDNLDGSFTCRCYSFFVLADNNRCSGVKCTNPSCPSGPNGTCYVNPEADHPINTCVCDLGIVGDACHETCSAGKYGFNCHRLCSCNNHGTCNPRDGCVCSPGWQGYDCLQDINIESPQFLKELPSSLSLPRLLPSGTMVVNISATDNDLNEAGNIQYFIIATPHPLPISVSDGSNVFAIDNKTGLITTIQSLSSLPFTDFLLTIVAKDLANHQPKSSVHLLHIELTSSPLPFPNFSESSYIKSFAENLPANETVLNVTCLEENSINDYQNLSISITSGNMNDTFELSGNSIMIQNSPDFETVKLFTLTLECRNYPFNQSTTVEVIFFIENVDDNDFSFNQSMYESDLYENVTTGTAFLLVQAMDADISNATVQYLFNSSSDFKNLFSINSTSGVLSVDAGNHQPFDRETRDNYTITIIAVLLNNGIIADKAGATVNIKLLDINDFVPMFSSAVYIVSNLTQTNSKGDVVLVVSAIDKDLNNNGLVQYAIENNPHFTIDAETGKVSVNTSMLDRGTFLINVTATDKGFIPLKSTALLNIFVQPVPNQIHFNESIYQFSHPENIPKGTTIGVVGAIVYDIANATIEEGPGFDSIEYTIISGSDTTPFHINTRTGEIVLISSLDYESEATYTLTISASLSTHPFIQASTTNVLLKIIDVNDNRPIFEHKSYASLIFSDAELGTLVLVVSASDKDLEVSMGELKYQIDESFNVPFNINSTTGEVTTSSSLQESPQDFHFLVEAVDSGGGIEFTSRVNVLISVSRRSAVKPLLSRSQYIFNILESFDGNVDGFVGKIEGLKEGNMSVDEEARFRIIPPAYNTSVPFTINATTGYLTSTSDDFDAETQTEFVFYVELYDTINTTLVFDTAPVVIAIIDDNDNAPVFTQTSYMTTLSKTTPAGSSLLTISASDLDSDFNGAVRYSLHSPFLGFHVAPQTGVVTVANSSLVPGDYLLSASATDLGTPPKNASVPLHISILPPQNPNITFSQPSYLFAIVENSAAGSHVGTIEVTAVKEYTVSPGDIIYSLVYNISCLSIASTGAILVSCNNLDREKQSLYNFPVVAVHSITGMSSKVEVKVSIEDVNDNSPVFNKAIYSTVVFSNYNFSVPILTAGASDSDVSPHNMVTYSFPSPSNLFTINFQTGELYLNISNPPAGDYSLTVVASDGNTSTPDNTATAHITIVSKVLQVLMFTEEEYSFTVIENSPGNTLIGILKLLAPTPVNPSNYLGNLDFQILSGDNTSFFHIHDDDGALLLVNNLLDREEANTHVLHIEASFKDYSVSASTYVTVSVSDDNDNSPRFNQTIYATIVGYTVEPNAQVVLAVKATDDDIGINALISYSIESGSPFVINSTSGEITVTSSPSPDHYSLTVTAEDSGLVSLSGTALVSIIVEVAPPSFLNFTKSSYTAELAENSVPGTEITTVALQQDFSNLDGLVFSISSNPYFTVGPLNGVITNIVTVDREIFTGGVYTITASISSNPMISSSTNVNITVTDMNDNRPVFTKSLYTPSYTFGTKGPFNNIQTIVVTDADIGVNAEVNLTLGHGGEMFSVNKSPTKIYVTPVSFNVPSGIYHFTIEAADGGTPSLTGTSTFLVTVHASIPSDIHFETPDTFVVLEDIAPGISFGSVSLQGPLDTSEIESIHYNTSMPSQFVTISNGIVDTQVSIACVAPLDFDNGVHQHIFTVNAMITWNQGNAGVASVTVTLNLTDVNDNPPVFQLPFTGIFTASVLENSSPNTNFFNPSVSDADSGINQQLTFRLANYYGARFNIVPNTGQVQTGFVPLDRETQSSYVLTVIATDQGIGHHSASATIRVNVLDANDNSPRLISGYIYTTIEELPIGTVAFTVTGADPDEGFSGSVRYFLGSGSPAVFAIPNPNVGEVIVAQRIDSDGTNPSSYSFTLVLRDSGFPSQQSSPLITVNILNAPNDNPPQFHTQPSAVMISPSLSIGDEVTTIVAYDTDPQDTVTYSIVAIRPQEFSSDLFQIDFSSGIISKGNSDILQPGDTVNVTIQVVDSSIYHLKATLELTVQVLKKFSFKKQQHKVNVSEDTVVGQVILSLELADSELLPDATFDIQPISVPFILHKQPTEINLVLNNALDRESVAGYNFTVTGRRQSSEGSTLIKVVVTDINDNTPVFTDPETRRFFIIGTELALDGVTIGKVNASDADAGSNAAITYSIQETSLFNIASSSGFVSFARDLNGGGSNIPIFVTIQDSGIPSQSATATYTIHIEEQGGEREDYGVVAVGVVLGIIVAILFVVIVVMAVMFSISRKTKKAKKRNKIDDPYDISNNWALKPTSKATSDTNLLENDFHTDTAYDTMPEEETMIDQQNMPWFNPAYKAARPNQKSQPPESVDTEEANSDYTISRQGSSLLSSADSPLKFSQQDRMSLRRGRVLSSVGDSSASESLIEENYGYLDTYKETTPMKPGEKGHEFDIFAKEDSNRHRRASIRDYDWQYKDLQDEQATSQVSQASAFDNQTDNDKTCTEQDVTDHKSNTKNQAMKKTITTSTPMPTESVVTKQPTSKQTVTVEALTKPLVVETSFSLQTPVGTEQTTKQSESKETVNEAFVTNNPVVQHSKHKEINEPTVEEQASTAPVSKPKVVKPRAAKGKSTKKHVVKARTTKPVAKQAATSETVAEKSDTIAHKSKKPVSDEPVTKKPVGTKIPKAPVTNGRVTKTSQSTKSVNATRAKKETSKHDAQSEVLHAPLHEQSVKVTNKDEKGSNTSQATI